jgi:hypothetical protein
MKRIFCILLALTACVSLSAQQRGDKAISAFAGATFSNAPYTSVQVAGEFDYFVADNFRLSFGVGVPFTSTTIGQVGSDKVKSNSFGVYFNPNIAYYVKLADRFYYTPELGGGYELGSYKQKYASTVLVNGKYNGYYIYFSPLYFEFKVNPRFSIGVAIGEFYYENFKYKDSSNQIVDKSDSFSFNLNSGNVCCRFYL